MVVSGERDWTRELLSLHCFREATHDDGPGDGIRVQNSGLRPYNEVMTVGLTNPFQVVLVLLYQLGRAVLHELNDNGCCNYVGLMEVFWTATRANPSEWSEAELEDVPHYVLHV